MNAHRNLALAGLCLLLAGCISLGKRSPEASMSIYDFGLPPTESATADKTRPRLAIEVTGAQAMESQGIAYRLAYVDPARRYEYAQARWVASPLSLIQQHVWHLDGHLVAGQAGARCKIRVHIAEFSQVFSSKTESHALLEGRLSLLGRDGRLMSEKRVQLTRQALSQDSAGGVHALALTVGELSSQLLGWENGLNARGELAGCR